MLPLASIPEKENNGSKRLSPTPRVSNLSLTVPIRVKCFSNKLLNQAPVVQNDDNAIAIHWITQVVSKTLHWIVMDLSYG